MKPALTPAQAKAKDSYLRKHYNITYEEYEGLRALQQYKCAICRRDEVQFKNGMAVDHNHKTGEVRGLLCWQCNRKLGKFQDDDVVLAAAAAYVHCPPLRVYLDLLGTGNQEFREIRFTAPGSVGTKARAKVLAKLNGTPTPKRRAHRGKRKPAVKRARAKRA